jgi:hypothetical protein
MRVDGNKTYPLGDTLGDNGDGLNLRVLHQLHGGAVDGTGGGKVHNGVNVWVLGHGLGDILVDRKESLTGTPVPMISESAAVDGNTVAEGGDIHTSC